MTKSYDVDGIVLNVVNPQLGAGGQGRVEQVAIDYAPNTSLVLKRIPSTPEAKARAKALMDLALPSLSPFFAAPLAVDFRNRNEIIHLAPFVSGDDLLSDNRSLPEHMEQALVFSMLMTILEEHGIAHGDLAPSNVMIGSDGAVYLIDFDNFAVEGRKVPKPQMAGQHMMLAPEIRRNKGQPPNIATDRFSAAIIYSLLLLRRHPAAAATTPAEVDKVLTQGVCPDAIHYHGNDEVPMAALGTEIPDLFDAAFSLTPKNRPSADNWRRALTRALNALVVHDCGHAFVNHSRLSSCPWCGGSIRATLATSIHALKITVRKTGAKFSFDLRDGAVKTIGRSNIGDVSYAISGRHLEITPRGTLLQFRHVGQNPTHILRSGKWYNLRDTLLPLDDILLAPITLKLADVSIDIGV